jgi:dipeptidyl aminopeptidase/acylaminoacyl peptidase
MQPITAGTNVIQFRGQENPRARSLAATAALAVTVAVVSLSVRAAPPPAEAFGRIPAMHSIDMNPSGTLLAWATGETDAPRVVIFDIDQRKVVREFGLGEKLKLRSLDWANDKTLLVTVSWSRTIYANTTQNFEIFRTQAIDADGGLPRAVKMSSQGYVIAYGIPDASSVVMVALDANITAGEYTRNLYHVNVDTGVAKRVAVGHPRTHTFAIDSKGEAVARIDYDGMSEIARVVAKEGQSWREVFRTTGNGPFDVVNMVDEPKSVLVVNSLGTKRSKLWRIPFNGSSPAVVAEDADRDIEYVETDRFTGLRTGLYLGGTEQTIKWTDPQAAEKDAALRKAFPNRNIEMYARTRGFERVLARINTMSEPNVYYLVDFAGKRADIVGEQYPQLARVALGRARFITYKARDGYSIPAYLITPPGIQDPKNLPLVLLPHGGPEYRDDSRFDWLAQFLATRGYAVLQPQFRGSTGFGEAHRRAGYRQWGKLMQNDVTDGVRALAEQGIIDSRRVCVVGWNYGGYVALAGVTITPGLYRCAVSINGISDLPTLIGAARIRGSELSNAFAYWSDHIGEPTDPDVIERSPARRAASASGEVLLLHAEKDAFVNIRQSELMESALKNAGKPVTLIRLAGEDHELSTSSVRLRVVKELEPFLAKHLNPAGVR